MLGTASTLIGSIVQQAIERDMRGVRMVMQRQREFPSTLQAQLTGIGLDPAARAFANRAMDDYFGANGNILSLPRTEPLPEIVVGSGFHAATYAATRVMAGKPAPWLFERSPYIGGAFAVRSDEYDYPGVFNLNSRNRRGMPGLSGDNEAQLNYLPGAPIQAAALSNAEYQSNADMAFVVRMTLAQYVQRSVFPGIEVVGVERGADAFVVTYKRNGTKRTILTRRVIDARGLGDPATDKANGTTVLTFPQFLQRMSGPWPLRGLRNVAVIGGGDSAKCVVESLFGLGPDPVMAAAELDSVNRVDWYGDNLATTYESWCEDNRGRYRAIGRYLRADKMGSTRLKVFRSRTADPLPLPDGPVLVNGRSYDLVIVATGNKVPIVDGLNYPYAESVYFGDREVARRNEDDGADDLMRYRIGPRAGIGFSPDEDAAGVSAIDANRVAMFRLGTRTAALAVQLD